MAAQIGRILEYDVLGGSEAIETVGLAGVGFGPQSRASLQSGVQSLQQRFWNLPQVSDVAVEVADDPRLLFGLWLNSGGLA